MSKASDAGKGDTPRPLSIPKKEYDKKWDKIFKKKKQDPVEELDWDKITTLDDVRLLIKLAFPVLKVSNSRIEEVRPCRLCRGGSDR